MYLVLTFLQKLGKQTLSPFRVFHDYSVENCHICEEAIKHMVMWMGVIRSIG